MVETWDENTPADTDLISGGDDIIRGLKAAIRERMDVEHVFTTGNEATVGEHTAGFITEAKAYIAAAAVTNANIKSATATPTADSIPIADGSGKVADGWGRVTYLSLAAFPEASAVGDSLLTTIHTLKTITLTLPTLTASGVAIIDIPLATYLDTAESVGLARVWLSGNYAGTHYGTIYPVGVSSTAEMMMRVIYRGTGGSVGINVYAYGIPNGTTVGVLKYTDMPVRCEVVTW